MFAGYRIDSLLGRGGTSAVYRAFELALDREVALKLLSLELEDDTQFRRRFLRESKIAASLQHPNVVPVYAAGEADGQLYIAMRLVENRDLRELLRQEGRLSAGRAVALCAQLASALDAAHASGLVHRDVKPSNVLLDRDAEGEEHVYLADFGLTRVAAGSQATKTGQLIGTIDYIAPEQIRGLALDGQSDIYSLGCLLYECLVGEPPFRRGLDVATLYAHLHDRPPAASERLPVLPVAIDGVLARALAKEPRNRFSSCADLVEGARAAFGLPIEIIERPWRVRRRSSRFALFGAAAALAAVTLTAVSLLTGGGDERRGTAVSAAAAAPGYRATLSEQLTSGAAGARTGLTLLAVFDDGRYPLGIGGGPAVETGEVVFRIDRRQLEPPRRGSGVYALLAAPAGTALGYVSFSSGGDDRVQSPLTKTGLTVDPRSGDKVVQLAQAISPAYRRLSGGPTLPLSVRVTATALVFTLNIQRLGQLAAAAGSYFSLQWLALHFFDSYVTFGDRQQFARNPIASTRFRAQLAARPCADTTCKTLGPPTTDAVTITLPNPVTVHAPRRAIYGQPTRFTGTGHPGAFVTVAYEQRPGSGPLCTPSNFDHLPDCGPRLRPAVRKITERSTRVAADGRWSFSLPLVSTALALSAAPVYQEPPRRSTSGYYAAVEYTGSHIWGPAIGGSFTVIAQARAATSVVLAKPSVRLRPDGRKLAILIAVRGGDRAVHYVLRRRGRTIAAGQLSGRGTAAVLTRAPTENGQFEMTVSATGTQPASATVGYRP